MGDTIVLRVDGTMTMAHSAGIGDLQEDVRVYSLGVWIDNTGELAALMPHEGICGANTAADLIEVLRQAITQVPADRRGSLLVTNDGAGASHPLIERLHSLGQARGHQVAYSIGFNVDERIRAACNRPGPPTSPPRSTPSAACRMPAT